MDYGSLFGGNSGGQQPKASSTAATIIGAQASNDSLRAVVPWIIGGAAVVAVAFLFLLASVLRK